MPSQATDKERRGALRRRCSGAIFWTGLDDTDVRQGWLIERSEGGAAFLTRGDSTPLTGTRMWLSTSDPADGLGEATSGMARRVRRLHADLHLVATQLQQP